MPRRTTLAAVPRGTAAPRPVAAAPLGENGGEQAVNQPPSQDLSLIVSAEVLAEAMQKAFAGKPAGVPEYPRLPSGRIMPGTIMDPDKPSKIKVPWTQRDMDEVYGKVTFTPRSSTPVTVNGVRFYLEEDEEITVPSIVKDVYDQHLRAQKRGEAAKRSYFQHVSVGPVPEEE